MSQPTINVLLVGKSAKDSAHLIHQLEQRGCCCWVAMSPEEGMALFSTQHFHVILNVGPVQEATQTLSLLGSGDCTVFCAYPVEEGCWWMPMMRAGRNCFGEPALRLGEFGEALDQILRQIRTASVAAPKQADAWAAKIAS